MDRILDDRNYRLRDCMGLESASSNQGVAVVSTITIAQIEAWRERIYGAIGAAAHEFNCTAADYAHTDEEYRGLETLCKLALSAEALRTILVDVLEEMRMTDRLNSASAQRADAYLNSNAVLTTEPRRAEGE